MKYGVADPPKDISFWRGLAISPVIPNDVADGGETGLLRLAGDYSVKEAS